MQALSTLIIDRFEGDFAICEREDCTMVTIEKSRLPKGVRPGNILKIEKDGSSSSASRRIVPNFSIFKILPGRTPFGRRLF